MIEREIEERVNPYKKQLISKYGKFMSDPFLAITLKSF